MPRSFPGAELERALGSAPACWDEVARGYAGNLRWRVELADGRRVFVKAAPDERRAAWLRTERLVYDSLASSSFLPVLIAWLDDPPALVLEDLGGGHWPPPWREADVAAVMAALEEIAATPPPAALPGVLEVTANYSAGVLGWHDVEQDPTPFLSLGLCSAAWLERSLPELRAAADAAPLGGDALLHFDVRSDNICLRDGRALLVDWNWACVGNPELDLAAWLPSLCCEGGPRPETILPDAGGLAAWLGGIWGAYSARPAPPGADPTVRELQAEQAAISLRWAAAALGLPPP